MAIVINGSGTVTGISVGGLPDGIVDDGTLATDAVTAVKIADNAVDLAEMASGTDGQIITYDASGNPTAVGPGTDGQVLTSTGAGSPPAFETAAGGGKILKVQSYEDTTDRSHTNNTPTDSGLSFSFTPTASSGTLIFIFNIALAQGDTSQYGGCRVKIGGTVRANTIISNPDYASWNENSWGKAISHTLASGSAVTFTVDLFTDDNTIYMNRPANNTGGAYTNDFITTLTVFEVSA
jgi:hypothetical protein